MRTYGRVRQPDGSLVWVEVSTSPDGDNSSVWLTTLCQCLLMVRGESPFYANYGIPAIKSVVQQLFPDFYVSLTQQQFSPYFASLLIARTSNQRPDYRVNIMLLSGKTLTVTLNGRTVTPT